jgi:protein gp37
MTNIEWADKTWNPASGCSPISEGCRNCYAEKMAKRLQAMGMKGYENGFAVTLHPDKLNQPLKWKKSQRIFVSSMGDLFHEDVPFDYIVQVFDRMDQAKHHTFMVLTKRPERALEFCVKYGLGLIPHLGERTGSGEIIPENVWFGVTAENQEQWNNRLYELFKIPATHFFVSVEPMLGPIKEPCLQCCCCGGVFNPITGVWLDYDGSHAPGPKLDWVICGCESGPKRRPTKIEWIRDLRDQCIASKTPKDAFLSETDGSRQQGRENAGIRRPGLGSDAMPALNFKKQFAPLVETFKKRQTIRALRKDNRNPRPGQTLYLYTGMRTKGCKKLGEATCKKVTQITIEANNIIVGVEPVEDWTEFVQADG